MRREQRQSDIAQPRQHPESIPGHPPPRMADRADGTSSHNVGSSDETIGNQGPSFRKYSKPQVGLGSSYHETIGYQGPSCRKNSKSQVGSESSYHEGTSDRRFYVGPSEDDDDEYVSLGLDFSCNTLLLNDAVSLLDEIDLKELERLGFAPFLKKNLGKICEQQVAELIVHNITFEEGGTEDRRIAVHLGRNVIYITPQIIYLILGLPRGNLPPLECVTQKETKRVNEFRAKYQLESGPNGLRIEKIINLMTKNLEDRPLKIKCFFLILISSFLMPCTSARKINTAAVLYTDHMDDIHKFDWCQVVFDHMWIVISKHQESVRGLRKGNPDKKGSRVVPGCILMILMYIVDNMHVDNMKLKDNQTCPRIEQYNIELLMGMIGTLKSTRGPTLRRIKLKPIEETCYPETSRYIGSSRDMESLHSVATSTVDCTSQDVPVHRGISLPLLHQVGGLLVEAQRHHPDHLYKSQVSECLIALKNVPTAELDEDQVNELYGKHVLSKIDSSDSRYVIDINDHQISEDVYVNAFKPEGEMVSVIIHAQCSIWNMQHKGRIYLKQECVQDLYDGETMHHLNTQLGPYLQKKTLKDVHQIFIPVYHARHFSLVVVNLQMSRFELMDSSPYITTPAVRKIIASMRQYLAENFRISGTNQWETSEFNVQEQNNTYDCGFRLMLHMRHFGTRKVYGIDEDMVDSYRRRFAVELLYNAQNRYQPALTYQASNSQDASSPNRSQEFNQYQERKAPSATKRGKTNAEKKAENADKETKQAKIAADKDARQAERDAKKAATGTNTGKPPLPSNRTRRSDAKKAKTAEDAKEAANSTAKMPTHMTLRPRPKKVPNFLEVQQGQYIEELDGRRGKRKSANTK